MPTYRCKRCQHMFDTDDIIVSCPECGAYSDQIEDVTVTIEEAVTPKGEPQPDITDKYLLDISIPLDSAVPLEVYIAFPNTLTNEEERKQVRRWWLYGNSKDILNMDLIMKNKISALFRPVGIMIDWKNIVVAVVMPSGGIVVIPLRLVEYLGADTEERIANLSDYLYITMNKIEDNLVAETVLPLRGKIENEIAHEVITGSRYTPLELIIMGLGYEPAKEVKRLFLPRIVTWFKGFDGKPMYVAQFTPPETGKTTFAIRNETLWNWGYIPEPPTLARLILNAQMGILGEVFQRNGIVFDEFEKWDLATQDRQYSFYALLTGMEQGKWTRGVSARGIRPPDIPRFISILFFGNMGDFQKYEGVRPYVARAIFVNIFTQRFRQDTSALADRLCIIDTCFDKIPIMDYLTYRVLPDAVLRGITSEVQRNVKPCNVSKLRGRLRRHSNNLYAILTALGFTITGKDADNMVIGIYDWSGLMGNAKQVPLIPPKPPERDTVTQKGIPMSEKEGEELEERLRTLRE